MVRNRIGPLRCYAMSTWRKSLAGSLLNLLRDGRGQRRVTWGLKSCYAVEVAYNQCVSPTCNIETPETRKWGGGLGEASPEGYGVYRVYRVYRVSPIGVYRVSPTRPPSREGVFHVTRVTLLRAHISPLSLSLYLSIVQVHIYIKEAQSSRGIRVTCRVTWLWLMLRWRPANGGRKAANRGRFRRLAAIAAIAHLAVRRASRRTGSNRSSGIPGAPVLPGSLGYCRCAPVV